MENNGNLVFYSRYNKALWATNTGHSAGASSKLSLSGHYDAQTPANSTLLLQVFNYSDMRVSSTLYKSP